MSKYLIKLTETYRADTEAEANEILEDAKQGGYEVTAYASTHKTTKDDDYYVVTLKKQVNNEKTPV